MLPRFGEDEDVDYYDFIAARMRNYMIHIMRTKNFKPKYFNPAINLTIQADHVARFYGCHMGRMLCGFPSIEETWSTRESFDAVGAVKDSIPKDAYIDMYRCMHFSDDWELEDEEWDEIFEDKKYNPSPDCEKHRRKFEFIENGFNRRWKECVLFGKWITADESRVAGWYRSGITIGPEPKPIRTGATIHSICVTFGELATYKLHCRVYGGRYDEGLDYVHENTTSTQKWVNLYNEMLAEFKGRGMCLTMDSAYMGDIMGQIGREEWEINMVGTCQSDQTGAVPAAKEAKAKMKPGTYESVLFQHRDKPLCYAMWSDNNIVKTLSNFHKPEILQVGDGVLRRKKVDGVREANKTDVSCPVQQRDYSKTFHLIDKGNGKESNYDMGGQTKGHNWAPKLTMRYWNFGLGNAHTMYAALVKKFTPDRRALDMPGCVKILTHYLLQRGDSMRTYRPEHPKFSRDLTNVFDFGTGRKIRTDAKGIVACGTRGRGAVEAPQQRMRELRNKQKKSAWRIHQSMASSKRGRCCWVHCPGLTASAANKKPRTYETSMRCEECSAMLEKNVFLCNDTKKGVPILCHQAYHKKYHNKKYQDDL